MVLSINRTLTNFFQNRFDSHGCRKRDTHRRSPLEGTVEPGPRLYEDEDIRGIEFPAGGRFVDLLAVDRAGGYVVIELKVSKGYDRVVGQLLRYMAWIRENLAEANQEVRGMIIARSISEDLKLASSLAPGIDLFEYELRVSVSKLTRP